MRRPSGYQIEPHGHRKVTRTINDAQEVLIIRSGKVKVDLFNDQHEFICTRILEKGDIILLASGGHGFEILEEAEMIEVKQGPYMGDAEKVVISTKVNEVE